MSEAEITDKIKDILKIYLGVNKKSISAESVLQDLGADTLDMVEIIIATEEEFLITLPEDVCDNIRTVGELIEAVKKHLKDRF